MVSPTQGSLRDRRQGLVLTHIRQAAHRLFAETSFAEVTTGEIAAAAGVSLTTYFRYAPKKAGLVTAPLVAGVAGIVDGFEERPAHKPAREALIRAITDRTLVSGVDSVEIWRRAARTAPNLLEHVSLLRPQERDRLVTLVAARMGTDRTSDVRPALLVHVLLAAVELCYQVWLSGSRRPVSPLHDQVEQALTLIARSRMDMWHLAPGRIAID
jgi:AcrR family transcriptional regulator